MVAEPSEVPHQALHPRDSPPPHSCHWGHHAGKPPADPGADSSWTAPSNAGSYWPSTAATAQPQGLTCHDVVWLEREIQKKRHQK